MTSSVNRKSVVRKSKYPESSDNWETIATRELANIPLEEAVGQLQSWNLHVFMRPVTSSDSGRGGSLILPSDIIFLEPPLNK